MTIVYDSRRKQLVFLSRDGEGASQLWFFPLAEHRWIRNPSPAPGGVSTREAVYIEAADAILAYGPSREDDPVWTRVFLSSENRWVPLSIDTPRYLVHEVALVYDPQLDVALLLWPPKFEREIRPHLFRLDTRKLR